jgi:hypothetical protein
VLLPAGTRRVYAWNPSFFCAQQAGLAERSALKIILKRQLSNFGVKSFNINCHRFWGFGIFLKDIAGTFKQVVSPLLDLVGVNVELLAKFTQGLLASNCG